MQDLQVVSFRLRLAGDVGLDLRLHVHLGPLLEGAMFDVPRGMTNGAAGIRRARRPGVKLRGSL
jgi:hypothetical protein